MKRDKRYGTRRWKATRLRVLHRDLWECFVPGCGVSASVADHIDPVYPGMPSAWFFDEANLRAICRHHNLRSRAANLVRHRGFARRPGARLLDHNDADGRPAAAVVVALDRTTSATGEGVLR